MEKKTIIVACASSMITSTIAANKIRQIASENNLPEPRILQIKFSEVQGAIATNKVDFIVPTGKLDKKITKDIPVISGMAFITGINEKAAEEKILEELKK